MLSPGDVITRKDIDFHLRMSDAKLLIQKNGRWDVHPNFPRSVSSVRRGESILIIAIQGRTMLCISTEAMSWALLTIENWE